MSTGAISAQGWLGSIEQKINKPRLISISPKIFDQILTKDQIFQYYVHMYLLSH